jgi:hypothetical protein
MYLYLNLCRLIPGKMNTDQAMALLSKLSKVVSQKFIQFDRMLWLLFLTNRYRLGSVVI